MRKGVALLLPIIFGSISCHKAEEPPQTQRLLIVVNKSDNTATVLDHASGKALNTVVTGVGPHEVAVDPGSGFAVITNYGTGPNPGSSLTVVDLHERRAVRTIGLRRFRRPHGIQFFADGRRVAVTVEGNQSVLVVNIESGEIEKVIRTDQDVSHMLVLSPDEKRAYVTNIGSDSLSILDIEGRKLEANIRIGAGAEGIDISADGKEVWIANREEDTLAVFDTETLEVVERIPCGEFPIRVRILPDGEHVMVSNARSGDVAVFSRSERRELFRIGMGLTAKEQGDRLLQFDLSPVPVGIVVDCETHKAFVANSNADIVSVIDTRDWKIAARLQAGEEPDGMGLFTIPGSPVPEG